MRVCVRDPECEDSEGDARFEGDTRALPDGLVGLVIEITTKKGKSWMATVLEVLHWDDEYALVRHSGESFLDWIVK